MVTTLCLFIEFCGGSVTEYEHLAFPVTTLIIIEKQDGKVPECTDEYTY